MRGVRAGVVWVAAWVAVGVVWGGGAGWAAAQDAAGQDKGGAAATAAWGPEVGERVDRAILRHSLGQFWGAVLLAKDGEVLLAKGYGYANEDLGPITAESLFDVASISKHFTCAAILQLEAEGKLKTSDTVSKFFPGLGERSEVITLDHLMRHESGLSDRSALQELEFSDRDEAVRRAMKSRFNGWPEEHFEYSNAGYVVLAAVIEVVTGGKYETYMRERVLAPAGMRSSGFVDGEGLDLTHGTARVIGGGRGGEPGRRTGITGDGWGWGFRGAAGIVTNMNDLVKWDRALAGEAVLGASEKEKLYEVGKNGYARGLFFETTDRGTRRVHHSGGTRGYSSQMSRFLDEGVLVAVLTNEAHSPMAIEEIVLKELFPRAPRAIEARLWVKDLKLGENKIVELKEGMGWRIGRDGEDAGRVVLEVVQTILDGEREVVSRAVVSMTAETASGLVEELEKLKRRRGGKGEEDEGEVAVVLNTQRYRVDDNVVRMGSRLSWWVTSTFMGADGEGKPITDKRPTIVLQDEETGLWPLAVRMGPTKAAALVEELRGAIAGSE